MKAFTQVCGLVLVAITALANYAAADQAGWIRVASEDKVIRFRPDGSVRTETAAAALPFRAQRSPDGARLLYVNNGTIRVGDADGKDARKVSPDGLEADVGRWSPDGRRIAF